MRLIGFDYRLSGDSGGVALLELTARCDGDEGIPDGFTLVISHDRFRRHCAGRLRRAQLVPTETDQELQWVVGFVAPARLLDSDPIGFQLHAPGLAPMTLPEPLPRLARDDAADGASARLPWRRRRGSPECRRLNP